MSKVLSIGSVVAVIAALVIGALVVSQNGYAQITGSPIGQSIFLPLLGGGNNGDADASSSDDDNDVYLPVVVNEGGQNKEPNVTEENLGNGWTLFTDHDLGFSIEYPEAWYWADDTKQLTDTRRCFVTSPGDTIMKAALICVSYGIGFTDENATSNISSMLGLANNSSVTTASIGSVRDNGSDRFELVDQSSADIAAASGATPVVVTEILWHDSPDYKGPHSIYGTLIYHQYSDSELVRISLLTQGKHIYERVEESFRYMEHSFRYLP